MKLCSIIYIFLFLLFSSCVSDVVTEDIERVKVGDMVPTFSVETLTGETFSSAGMSGKSYLIMFFSTTCPDCQRQLPEVNQAYQQLGRIDAVIAISRAEAAETVATFWHDHNLLLPVAVPSDRNVYELFATRGVPRLYFVDSRGTIASMSDDGQFLKCDQICSYLTP